MQSRTKDFCLDCDSTDRNYVLYCITQVKTEITCCISEICSEINVRRKFTCFETYCYIDCVVNLSTEISPIFCPKLGEEQKKRSSLKFRSVFRPNVGASLEETQRTYPLCDQT